MPYYIVPIGLEPETVENWADYLTVGDRAMAGQHVATWNADPANGPVRALFRETEDEAIAWRDRERARFDDGTYQPVPWAHIYYPPETVKDHFPHLSRKQLGMMAYTPSPEHGVQDRQIIVKPGKYLVEFLPSYATDHARWIGTIAATGETLKIATTADDIERVYRGRAYASQPFFSCMGPDSHKNFAGKPHPTRAYGDSDLAVAYLGPIDAVLARCVVWPAQKTYTERALRYGLTHLLRAKLEDAGYTIGSMRGARLKQVPHNGRYWAFPYIDCPLDGPDYLTGAYADGDAIVLDRGPVSIYSHETGLVSQDYSEPGPVRDEDEDEDEPEPETYCCDHCGDRVEGSDGDDQYPYCDSCYNDRSYCDICETDTWDGTQPVMRARSNGRAWEEYACEDCVRHHDRTMCACCDDDFNEWTIDVDDQRRRHRDELTHLCEDCEDAIACAHEDCNGYNTPEMIDRAGGICPSCDRTQTEDEPEPVSVLVATETIATEPEPEPEDDTIIYAEVR